MIRFTRLAIMLSAFMVFASSFAVIGASAQTADTYGTAYFSTPSGESPTGALLTLTTADGTVLRTGDVGENNRIIWLFPRFIVGQEYCLSVDGTALGYQPWYGCSVAQPNKLHFDVSLDYILAAGSVTQNGTGGAVSGSSVCLAELGVCTTTDASGNFVFTGIVPGTYTVTIDTEGYKSTSSVISVTPTGGWVDVVQYKGNGSTGNGNN